MNNLTVIRYTFLPYFKGYYQEGNWFDENDKMIKEKYYNGRPCLDVNHKRYGLKKLKQYAIKQEVNQIELPF